MNAVLHAQAGIDGAIRATVLAAVLLLSSAASAGQPGNSAAEPKRSYGSIDVILYSTSWCTSCARAREFLQSKGVSLVEYDIEKDAEKHREMLSKSGIRRIPVIDIEGIIVRGYSEAAIRNAIEKKRRE